MSQIDRCFDILEALHASPEGLQLSTLSQTLDLPKSAVHRLLTALKARGYVEQIGDSGLYRATLMLSLIGARYFSETSLRALLEPIVSSVGAETGELTRLSMLVGGELTWVLSNPGRERGLRYDGHSGRRVVPHTTATGRLWLASMTEEDAVAKCLAAGLGKPPTRQLGPNAIQTVQALLEQVAITRERGYGMVEEEAEIGVSSLACPILDGDRFLGAISIAGPTARLDRERLEKLAPRLKAAAEELSTVFFRWREFCGPVGEADLGLDAEAERIAV